MKPIKIVVCITIILCLVGCSKEEAPKTMGEIQDILAGANWVALCSEDICALNKDKNTVFKSDEPDAYSDVKTDTKLTDEEIAQYLDWMETRRQNGQLNENEMIVTKKTDEELLKDKKEFMEQCQKYKYKDIFRNAEDYVGKKAKFTGEVIQVQEGNNGVALRVNVTKDKYGFYDDTVYVVWYTDMKELDPEAVNRLIEDDVITMYGVLDGTETYTSVMNAEITIPRFEAHYIVLK